MRRIQTLKMLLAAILLVFAQFGRAAIPAGNFTINVSGQVPIWDVSGDYHNSLGNLAIDFILNVDNKGRITGAGMADIADYVDVDGGQFYVDLHSNFSYTGTISSAGGVTRVKFKFKIKGSGVITDKDDVDHTATLNSTLNVSAEVDENSHEIMGTISGSISAKAKGLGSESQKIQAEEYSLPLPDDMDGSWRVDLTGVQVTGKKISGTAVVHLSNGRTVGLQVTGTYDAMKDVATYNLKGTAQQSSSGDNLKVTGVSSVAGGLNANGFDAVGATAGPSGVNDLLVGNIVWGGRSLNTFFSSAVTSRPSVTVLTSLTALSAEPHRSSRCPRLVPGRLGIPASL